MIKKVSLILIILCFCLTVFGCAPKGNKAIKDAITITDCANRTVAVPKAAKSICVMCPFSGPIVVMLGCGDKVTTAVNNMTRSNLLTTICPSVGDAYVIKNSGSFNAEAIIEAKTDLIFVNSGTYYTDDERKKLDAMGIPYVVVGYEDLDSQLDAILVIGKALGKENKAKEYTDWCKGVYENAKDTAKKNEEPDISLYHAVNEATRTDESGDICSEWIGMSGVYNVSLDADLVHEGDKAYTTLEQIYTWNPDIIIANEPGVDDYILSDEKWKGLRCVRDKKVYQIPVGIARMGHPTSTETPIALMWLMDLLYGKDYGIDFKNEIKSYYKNFYDFDADESLINAIIEGDEMRQPKSESKE